MVFKRPLLLLCLLTVLLRLHDLEPSLSRRPDPSTCNRPPGPVARGNQDSGEDRQSEGMLATSGASKRTSIYPASEDIPIPFSAPTNIQVHGECCLCGEHESSPLASESSLTPEETQGQASEDNHSSPSAYTRGQARRKCCVCVEEKSYGRYELNATLLRGQEKRSYDTQNQKASTEATTFDEQDNSPRRSDQEKTDISADLRNNDLWNPESDIQVPRFLRLKEDLRNKNVSVPHVKEASSFQPNVSFQIDTERRFFDFDDWCYKNNRRSKSEPIFSLVSICITLMMFQRDDLKQKIRPFLLALPEDFGIRSLVEAILKHFQVTSELTSGVDDCLKIDKARNPLLKDHPETTTKRTPATSKENRSVNTPDKDTVYHDSSKKSAFNFSEYYGSFLPKVPSYITVFPAASFLPSLGSPTPNNMIHEGCRLASLNNLPASCTLSRVRLAQTGFYYDVSKPVTRDASNAHEVVCYSCGLTHGRWTPGDNPAKVHLALKPDCRHLEELNARAGVAGAAVTAATAATTAATTATTATTASAAVPSPSLLTPGSPGGSLSAAGGSGFTTSSGLGRDSVTSSQLGRDSSTSSGRRNIGSEGDLATDSSAIAPSPLPLQPHIPNNQSVQATSSNQNRYPAPRDTSDARAQYAEDRPAVEMGSAVYPQFCGLQQRRATFSTWPLTSLFNPDQLVMMGFYYAGYADCLRCFYCGVGLKSWAEEDDVMTEHIRWRPSCGYILNIKGRQFVDNVLARLQSGNYTGEEQNQTTDERNARGSTTISTANSHGTTRSSAAAAATPPSKASTSQTTATNVTASPQHPASTVSQETLSTAADMGFSNEVIARAVRHFTQQGTTNISAETLLDKLIELDTDTDNSSSSTTTTTTSTTPSRATTSTTQHGLQTDGASAGEPAPHAEEVSRAQRVAQENAGLKRKQTCKVCGTQKVGVVYLPCGHVVACAQCGARTRHCSHCGEYIKATANVYLS